MLNHYQAKDLTGINISEDQLAVCKANLPEVEFLRMDAADMTFPDQSFENIICVEAASHFFTRENYLREAYRLLKPGGRLVFSDCLMSIDSPTQPKENYVSGRDEYAATCRRAGFDSVVLHGVKKECWEGFSSHMGEYIINKFRAGEISWRDRMLAIGWLSRVEPEDYIIGWCEKAA